jgi:sec-independent protein translocase protein TatA
MMRLGTGEFLMLGIVILIIFSASRMGQLGNALGKFMHAFKKASKGNDLIDVTPSSRRVASDTVDGKVTERRDG